MTLEELYFSGITEDPNELYHHGILGMKWGIRRYQPYPKGYKGDGKEVGEAKRSPRKTRRMARKDAKEYARAKMFYGEGAGTRRKLINNTVNQRSKDSAYKTEFEKALSEQNMEKAVKKAKKDRKVADVKSSTAKTARGLINISRGNIAFASAASVGLFYAGKAAYKYGPTVISKVKNDVKVAQTKQKIERMMREGQKRR